MPELIVQYLRKRYRARRFVPLAALLAVVGSLAAATDWGASSTGGLRPMLVAVVAAYFLVLAFRVWDDLQDRRHDAAAHPDRVTVRASTTLPFVLLLGASVTLSALIVSTLSDATLRLTILARLAGTLAIWYWARARLRAHPIVGAHVVLAKYPVIAYVVAPSVLSWDSPHLVRGLSLLAVLYLALCIYECADDPELRRVESTKRVRALETALLASLLCLVGASILLPQRLFLGGGPLP